MNTTAQDFNNYKPAPYVAKLPAKQAAAVAELFRAVGYEVSDLPSLGWITITSMGEENLYFMLANGQDAYVKIEG